MSEDPPAPLTGRPRIPLTGIGIDPIGMETTVAIVRDSLDAGRGGWIVTANVDQMRLMHANPDTRRRCEQASLVVADGMPLLWAARIRDTPLPERVAGSDLVWRLADLAATEGAPLFLLGGDPGTAEQAAEVFEGRYPGLRIAGVSCPPFGFEHDERAMAELRRQVRSSGARLVYVALGFPKQELLIEQLRQDLPQAWFLGCGISFSFVSGDVKRAPGWMHGLGLEWLHRLTQEPGRLGKRYLIHDPPFALRLLVSALRDRFAG